MHCKGLFMPFCLQHSIMASVAYSGSEASYWLTWHWPAQVVGFMVLLSGSALYNEIIKACLPLDNAGT